MKALLRTYMEASLILRVSIALVLGVVVGLLGGQDAAQWLAPFGELLLRLLKFLIVPIVLFTLMVGINQAPLGSTGRLGRKLFGYYVVTSALAIMVGLAVATFFAPGSGMTLDESAQVSVPDNPGIANVLLNIVPDNIVAAFVDGNLLGIIFTAMAFGIALLMLRNSDSHAALGERLYGVIEALNEVTLKVMSGVLHYVPIGVFAIVAKTVGQQGMETLLSLGDMVAVLYIALAAQLVVYGVLMKLFGVRLRAFFREARTPMATAFATQSSSGTLPLTLNASRRLGHARSLYGFSLPLGGDHQHGWRGDSHRDFGGVRGQCDRRAAGSDQHGPDRADRYPDLDRDRRGAGGRHRDDRHGLRSGGAADRNSGAVGLHRCPGGHGLHRAQRHGGSGRHLDHFPDGRQAYCPARGVGLNGLRAGYSAPGL